MENSKIRIHYGNVVNKTLTGPPIVGDPKDGYPYNPRKTYNENLFNCKNYWKEKNCYETAIDTNYPGIINKTRGEKKYKRDFANVGLSQPGRQYTQAPTITQVNPNAFGGKRRTRTRRTRTRRRRR